jgi:uncharacterized protein
MKKTLIAAIAAAALLGVPAAASAHVTVNPRQAEAGSFSILTVRVPNERDTKGTVKVDLRLPHGFYFLSYKKVPGWTAKLTKTKLDKPVTIEGLKITREVTRVVWTGDKKKGGIIEPDQFEEFPLSVRVPDGAPGTELVFRAFQSYEGGEKVSWTGSKDADEPAPRVTLTAPAAPTATAAHAPIKTISPKAGAHASTSLRHVTATFKEAIVSGSLSVYRGRTKVSIGKAALIKHKEGLQAHLHSNLSAGKYTAKLKWLADDGHLERKTWSFTLS